MSALKDFALSDGLTLRYLQLGERGDPDLVLLHGGGLDSCDWQQVAPVLAAAGYRVTVPDQRGCGESDWDSKVRYGVEQSLVDLDALLGHLGIGELTLVGHSLGAVSACVYTARNPGRVVACVMEDGGPADHTRPSSLESPTLVFDSEAHALAALGKSLPRGVPGWVLESRFHRLDDGRLTWRSDIAGRVRWSAEGGEPLIMGLWPSVEAITSPTLVVRGAESPLFKIDYAERMVELNPMISLVTIPDAGHLVHCEQPEAFTAAVLDFLGR
ncbi:MAG TPA: alpha/beta hydrolase [Gaiellaceae bacterium]|nr:alpha/beta hydrolase [Gaiellaceae bacterium]